MHLLSTLPHPKRGSQWVFAGRICPLQWGAAGIGGHRLGARFEEEGILQAEGKRIHSKQDQRSFILSLCFCAAISIIPFSFSYLTFISRENHRRMTWDSSPAPAKPDSKQGSATTFCDEILIENSATQEEVQNSRSPLYTNLFLFNSSLAVSEHFSSLHTKKKQNSTFPKRNVPLVRNFKINYFCSVCNFFLVFFLCRFQQYIVKQRVWENGLLCWRRRNFSMFCSFSCGKKEKEIK